MSLEGRVALVTGASRGIGRAIAVGLARDGADVAVGFQREEAAAKECVDEIERLGRRARAYRASVESYPTEGLVESATRDLGPIDIFICNAGVHWHGARVRTPSRTRPSRTMRINALGPLYLCRLVLPGMRKRRRGDIVIVSRHRRPPSTSTRATRPTT